jgi:hypothetical protein
VPELYSKPNVLLYHLGPGDRLEIKVLGADELNGQYTVQDDGTIRMLLVGVVPAAGLTPDQCKTSSRKNRRQADTSPRRGPAWQRSGLAGRGGIGQSIPSNENSVTIGKSRWLHETVGTRDECK